MYMAPYEIQQERLGLIELKLELRPHRKSDLAIKTLSRVIHNSKNIHSAAPLRRGRADTSSRRGS